MKPILFNTEMVRAILDGQKTQMRRVVKFPEGMTGRLPPSGANDYLYYPCGIKYPQYQKGDILWVRETWAKISDWAPVDSAVGIPDGFIYRADWPDGEDHPKWHPSIHMPKEAARLFLRVTDVRVERLWDITSEDLYAEGTDNRLWAATRDAFRRLWDSTIKSKDRARYGWDANPWVWVYTFKRCEVITHSEFYPTHWLPLPEPPKAEGGADNA